MTSSRILVVRPDGLGDVLLSGPAVRALAASGAEIVYLASPGGADAARLLPGVDSVLEAELGWIAADPPPITARSVGEIVNLVARAEVDEAVILTSFHQSPLPTALCLRMAGVEKIGAISNDYPGSLIDVRHQVDDDLHEVERSLSLVARLGYRLPPEDDSSLRIRRTSFPPLLPHASVLDPSGYVVVHPGASVRARAPEPETLRKLCDALVDAGTQAVVTGGLGEAELTALVAGDGAVDLGGLTDPASLAALLASADVLVAGNTGPAHLAAAVGCPVVSLFAPTVPAGRWRPWNVPHHLLGAQEIACAGCRARACPIEGHPCIASISVDDLLAAVSDLRRVGVG